MHPSSMLLLLALFALSGWHCATDDHPALAARQAATPPPFDADAIVAKWVDLWNTYDLSLVDSLFLTDNRLTYFSSEKEGLIQGIEAVREHHVGFGFVAGGTAQENALWLEDLHTQSFGTVATVQGTWYFRNAASDSTTRGPVTFVYVADGETYRIGHVHFANY